MKISLIAAVAQNGVIGRNNDLPWHLPDDIAFFKHKIRDQVAIMGRKSLEAQRGILPSLVNIAISRNYSYKVSNAIVVHDFKEAIEIAAKWTNEEIFVIGGAEIYNLAMPIATTLYLTEIHKEYEGDSYFPQFDRSNWKEFSRQNHPSDEQHEVAFDYVSYEHL
ncbi:dihydrofolate reductase [Spirosoma radiotolerans]|uniref:Dihydrofolate reductase n=1 Tax=Spirosoma radiotolerans TaxID=1379870 RepID=A0A0E3V630_9BACT|nr:dihydrofolate reductase [Spirosoma radiotolerans]AKD54672.1 diacylglycerol kinase [Spirosoma radiotolerans]